MDMYQKWWTWFRGSSRWVQIAIITGFSVLLVLGLWLSFTGTTDQPATDLVSSSAWMASVFFKLVLVLLLIIGCAIFIRKWMNSSVRSSTRQMQLTETLTLTPKRALHIVQVGKQLYLIGATDQGISLISELDEGAGYPSFHETLIQTGADASVNEVAG